MWCVLSWSFISRNNIYASVEHIAAESIKKMKNAIHPNRNNSANKLNEVEFKKQLFKKLIYK